MDDRTSDIGEQRGRDNRGKPAGATAAGEAIGSGAGAGGGGNPEDIDSDSAGGSGTEHFPDQPHPETGGDAKSHGSA